MDLFNQIADNMEQGEECIVIDSDSGEEEEEEAFSVQEMVCDDYIIPNIYHDDDDLVSDILDNQQEDPEIEVIYDSKMPSLIPLTVSQPFVVDATQINTQPTYQARSFQDVENPQFSNLVAELQSLLECKVCYTIINTTPVRCCPNGHPTCTACWTRCHRCPVCRVPCHSAPPCYAQTIHDIIHLIPLPCKNKYRGCMVEGEEALIATHQNVCPYMEAENRTVGCDTPGCMVGH